VCWLLFPEARGKPIADVRKLLEQPKGKHGLNSRPGPAHCQDLAKLYF
jgi:hypothetical protein